MSDDGRDDYFPQHPHAPRSRAEIEKQLDEQYPNRPRNHGKSRPFHTLFQELFNPLMAINQNKAAAAGGNPRKVGPDGQSKLSPSERRRAIIERYIARWRKDVGPDFFPALRLINPRNDRERGVYGLKEKIIAKLLIKIMKIDKNSRDGQNLLNWKNAHQTGADDSAGSFPKRCYAALKDRHEILEVGDMTIDEVNELLDNLSAASKEEDQLRILTEFSKRMNAEELMWLIRIILKEMRVGASEKTFFYLWHPDAEKLFNISSSLRRVCWELYDPSVRLEDEETAVTLMQCFQPMLAKFKEGEPLSKIVEGLKLTLEDPEFWIEEKLDGERMQMHMETDDSHPGGKRFRFWSRKAKEYTYLYGNGFEDPNGALTQSIKNCFADGVESIILDGEMITWDPKEQAMVPFGSLKTAALAEQRNPFGQGHRPLFRIFDIVLLNGQSLTRYTLRDRRRALAASIINEPERFEIHDYVVARKVEEVEELLRKVIAEASEGLVLKNPRSMYLFDDRTGDWRKVKPEYMDGFGEDLDCVVLGGYFGSGRRGGILSSFVCGLRASQRDLEVASQERSQSQSQLGSQNQSQRRKPKTQSQASRLPPSQRQRQTQTPSQSQSINQSQMESQAENDELIENFTTFFRVGGGMTANDYATIRHLTDGKWHEWNSRRPAPQEYIDQGDLTKLKEKPDMWIKPSDSIVFQVKAAQVVISDEYGLGFTLRFPRFVSIRRDRDWTTALSVNGFRDLKIRAEKDARERQLEIAEKRNAKRKTRAGGYASRKKQLTVAGYNARDVDAVKLPAGPEGNVFRGLTFYIMTESTLPGAQKMSKLELEALVKANGGKIVQTATPTSSSMSEDQAKDVICIASRRTVKVASVEKHGEKEIVKPVWIFDCLEQARRDFALGFVDDEIVVPFEPERHLFFATEDAAAMYEGNVDDYGDSFARDTTADELKDIMQKMDTLTFEDDQEAIPDLFGDEILNMKGFLFFGLVFFFDLPHSRSVQANGSDVEAQGSDTALLGLSSPSSEAIARFAGAQVIPSTYSALASLPSHLKSTITHIITGPCSDLADLRRQVSRWDTRKIPMIVKYEWIDVCWNEGTRVDEREYISR